jgi:hypothetical protein
MGKGDCRGTAAEMIMYFLTNDYHVDCDLMDFEVTNKIGTSKSHTALVKWKNYSYQLTTNHFNINKLVDDIITDLSLANLEDFCYKPQRDTPMRMDAWNVLGEKFGRKRVDVGWVYHYPAKDEWHLTVKLLGRDLKYIHQGSPYEKAHTREIGMYFMETYPEYLL